MSVLELPVYDKTGKQIETISVDTSVIANRISPQLMHEAVVMYQANLRQGSAKTKTRAEVAGHKKKMYKQKGTGNARAGHRRSGVRRGGGHIFAKCSKDWSYRMPRKALQSATKMAIAAKFNDAQVFVIDTLEFDCPKTKISADILKCLGIVGSVLVSTEAYDLNVYKSFRNIVKVKTLPVFELNAFEVLKSKQLLMTKDAVLSLIRRASNVPQS